MKIKENKREVNQFDCKYIDQHIYRQTRKTNGQLKEKLNKQITDFIGIKTNK